MAHKYPNKKKRKGFWKKYEDADIKNHTKVWRITLELIREERNLPFSFSSTGRKPNLSKEEIVGMAVLYQYFDLDFREDEHLVFLLSGKQLDHSNCVRWFGRLTLDYVNRLVHAIHQKIIHVSDTGDYIADSTQLTCDRLKPVFRTGKDDFEHVTWKLHILVQYIYTLGLLSIVNVFASRSEASDSPPLREHFLNAGTLSAGKKLHADKGYFGKENLQKCRDIGLVPNIVPKDQTYTDTYLKRYIATGYDNESRKKNRGMVEGVFGGIETETGAKIRCRKPHHRDLCAGLSALKHNLRTYFRATALNLISRFRTNPDRLNKFK